MGINFCCYTANVQYSIWSDQKGQRSKLNRPDLSQGLKWAFESKLSTNLLDIREPMSLSSPNPVLFPIHWVSQWTCFWRITADASKFIIYNQGGNDHASIFKEILPTERYFRNITTPVKCAWQWSTRKAELLWSLPAHFSFHHLCNSAVLPPFPPPPPLLNQFAPGCHININRWRQREYLFNPWSGCETHFSLFGNTRLLTTDTGSSAYHRHDTSQLQHSSLSHHLWQSQHSWPHPPYNSLR